MRTLAQLIGVLLVVGFVLAYWWVIVLVLAGVVAVKLAPVAYRRYRLAVLAEERRLAGLTARADQQHAQVLVGETEACTARTRPRRWAICRRLPRCSVIP
jgi:biopolymer transport protein ExbB/TolQ